MARSRVHRVYRWEWEEGGFKFHHARSPRSGGISLPSRLLHPSSLVAFHILQHTFLAVGFRGDGLSHNTATLLYKLDAQNDFELPHSGKVVVGRGFDLALSVPSAGVVDVEFVSISTEARQPRNLLIIANGNNFLIFHFILLLVGVLRLSFCL
jgi:hypothetical protein